MNEIASRDIIVINLINSDSPSLRILTLFFFVGESSPAFLGEPEWEVMLSVSAVSSERVSMSTSKSESERSPNDTKC